MKQFSATNSHSMKIKVALLFGGNSAEHDISIISALQAGYALDKEKYEVYPIYLAKNGEMYWGDSTGLLEAYTGGNLPLLLKRSFRVTLMRRDGQVFLYALHGRRFFRKPVTALDVALPIVHGTNAEDGTLQGYLQTLGLPYAGCDVTSSAVGMDKFITKVLLKHCGIPVLDCLRIASDAFRTEPEAWSARIEAAFAYPVIVKPVNCGSSIGIAKADDRDALNEALEDAFHYADTVIVERAIVHLREINCSVLGNAEHAEASVCEEPLKADEILSFNDKYLGGAKGDTKNAVKGSFGGVKTAGAGVKSSGMASLKRKIPASIPEETRDLIQKTAIEAFRALDCCGVARIDFLMDTDTGKIFFNEINTIPGSLSFYLWEPTGIKYPELLDRLISLALKRERRRQTLTFSFASSVLDDIHLSGAKSGSKF